MEAIPIYPMMTNEIPKMFLDKIQRLKRGFNFNLLAVMRKTRENIMSLVGIFV
jgi:hypothetical protein